MVMKYLSGNVKNIWKMILFMYGVTAVLLFLFALIVQKTQMKESGIAIGIGVVYVLVCFFGGFLAGKVQKKQKFLWGLFLGSLYFVIMFLISLGVKNETEEIFYGIFWNLLLCLGGGMLGGMIS